MWCTRWHCDRFLSQSFCSPCQYHSTNAPYPFIHLPPTLHNVSLPVLLFPLSVSFHQCSTLIFIYTLVLPEGQTGETWEPPKKQCSYGNPTSTVTTSNSYRVTTDSWPSLHRLFPSCANFCIHGQTPLPRGVYYNLNIPNWGHTPCRTTPISPVNYAIKRPPLGVTHTDHKSII